MIIAPDFISQAATDLNSRIEVVVVGAGGTGSSLMGKLLLLHNTLVALGGVGLNVTLYDDDIVTHSNVGRQQYYHFDVGSNKAETLINRFNNFSGVNWTAVPERFTGEVNQSCVIFGCVDNVASRKLIHKAVNNISDNYRLRGGLVWIDCGNERSSANAILGMNAKVDGKYQYLPTVVDLYKEQMENYVDTNTDSCSHSDALHKQDLGVNDMVAAFAHQMLWQLIRHGQLAYQGVTLDLTTGTSNSFKACPEIWAMYGYEQVA